MYPSLAYGVVGVMELDTPVEAQDCELDVESQSDTGIECQLLIECVERECGTFGYAFRTYARVPDITQVEECGTVEHTPYRESEFEVCLQLHIGQLAGIDHLGRLC